MARPILDANAAAFSTRPERINLFFCRSMCLTAGVTYGGSEDVTMTVCSVQQWKQYSVELVKFLLRVPTATNSVHLQRINVS